MNQKDCQFEPVTNIIAKQCGYTRKEYLYQYIEKFLDKYTMFRKVENTYYIRSDVITPLAQTLNPTKETFKLFLKTCQMNPPDAKEYDNTIFVYKFGKMRGFYVLSNKKLDFEVVHCIASKDPTLHMQMLNSYIKPESPNIYRIPLTKLLAMLHLTNTIIHSLVSVNGSTDDECINSFYSKLQEYHVKSPGTTFEDEFKEWYNKCTFPNPGLQIPIHLAMSHFKSHLDKCAPYLLQQLDKTKFCEFVFKHASFEQKFKGDLVINNRSLVEPTKGDHTPSV